MIYFEGLESVAEAIYLSESLSNRFGDCNIFVNPSRITYLVGKLIIINMPDYPKEDLETLLSQNCKVISRVWLDDARVEFSPYILRIDKNILWNGKDMEEYPKGGLQEMLENDLCSFSLDDYVLYFPRISHGNTLDSKGNLTVLGWVLQQTGCNLRRNTPFINLDLLKSKKIVL